MTEYFGVNATATACTYCGEACTESFHVAWANEQRWDMGWGERPEWLKRPACIVETDVCAACCETIVERLYEEAAR